jgi:hypothetical protein
MLCAAKMLFSPLIRRAAPLYRRRSKARIDDGLIHNKARKTFTAHRLSCV